MTEKCSFCFNEAKFSLTKVDQGIVEIVNFCSLCLQELPGLKPEVKIDIESKITDCYQNNFKELLREIFVHDEEKICPNCGMDLKTVVETGILGCEQCAKFFGLAENVHEVDDGKELKEKELEKEPEEKKDSEDLKKQLELAIKDEDFKKAAEIRDLINANLPERDLGKRKQG